jgi:hypothetical protein
VCGYVWQSQSRSGRTRCPECRARTYIPVALRRAANYLPDDASAEARPGHEYSPYEKHSASHEAASYFAPATLPKHEPAAVRVVDEPDDTPPQPGGLVSLAALGAVLVVGAVAAAWARRRPPRWPVPASPPAPAASPLATSMPTFAHVPARGPSWRSTRAVLACGHTASLGGPPQSWIGVAVPCTTCGQFANVDQLPQIGYRR